MKRMMRRVQDTFYNEGSEFMFIPTVRREVIPGQSTSGSVDVKVKSQPFTKFVMSNARIDHWLFYVPHRLVWPEFVDFVTEDVTPVPTLPTTSTTWDIIGDHTGTHSALFRRAFKLCLNSYFLSDEHDVTGTGLHLPYADITTDTDVTDKRALTTEQITRASGYTAAYDLPTYDATTTPIDLLDFKRSLERAVATRKQQSSGDRYIDVLARMGVRADWKIRVEPELLSRTGVSMASRSSFGSTASNLGVSFDRYEGSLTHRLPRKMFAEHGYLIGFCTVRPDVINDAQKKSNETHTHVVGEPQKSFFLGENDDQVMDVNLANFTGLASTDVVRRGRFEHIYRGQRQFGLSTNANAAFHTPDTWARTMHPTSGLPYGGSGPSLSLMARSSFEVLVPIDPDRLTFQSNQADVTGPN